MGTLRRLALTRHGSTLVELVVATVVMSVGILGLFGAFRFITRSIFVSRGQSLATNLAQERVEYLKNINYYALLVTTAPAVDNDFTPGLNYDTASYPPETISIAGITYTRYTHVAMAQIDSDVISEVAYTYPDTGMKQISVHVLWTDNGVRKKWSLRNLLENPYVNPLDATITGTVSRADGGGGIAGALVSVEQNPDWNATTNSSGDYNFRVYHGTYSVRASSGGFYNAISSTVVVAKSSSKNVPITMTAIATGTVSGNVWYNSDLVISQVVSNTFTWVGGGEEKSVEYIELFNPTTYNINTAANAGTKYSSILYYDEDMSCCVAPTPYYRYILYCQGTTPCTYYVAHSTFVPAKSYYLIANSSHFLVNGQWVDADAHYYNTVDPDYPDIMRNIKAGGLYLYKPLTGAVVDSVGWADNDNSPPAFEGNYIPDIGAGNDGIGIPAGKQIVRVSSPGVNMDLIPVLGRAYDSNSNARDWMYTYLAGPSFFYSPYTVASGTFPVVTGKPAHGAYVSASDYNSGSTQTVTAYISSGALSLPYAPFSLRGVSTGTWDVVVAYNTYFKQVSTVVVTQNSTTSLLNAATTPSWSSATYHHVHLDSGTAYGFVRGVVTDASSRPLASIRIDGGGNTKTTGTNGLYFMPVSSGTFNVIANPNNLNASYIQDIAEVTVTSGNMTVKNFSLALGARLQGYATSGTTPLSNVVFTANVAGSQYGTGTTDATGVFNIRNISTGTYTVQPVLEVGQDANPNSQSVTFTSTGTVFVATFTITGSFGAIAGSVSDAGGLVTSGALIVASTSSISSTPPAIVGSSAPAMTPYYMASSRADGTYTMPVRGSNTYYLSVYVPVITGAGVSITTKTYSGIVVAPSATTTKNVSIP